MRLRAWGLDRALSGDVITEQNIHALDVATWVLDAAPLHAVGTGGRKARTAGTCWDHFSVTFTFPADVVVTFASKQLGDGWDDICCRIYGTEGTLDSHYFGEVSIRGKLPYRGGKIPNLYTDGAVANIATFHDSITRGDFSNPTVAPSVRSNLTTILGRTAAWRHGKVTWDEMMGANEALEAGPRRAAELTRRAREAAPRASRPSRSRSPSARLGRARRAPGGQRRRRNSLGMRMVLVPAGSFGWGAPPASRCARRRRRRVGSRSPGPSASPRPRSRRSSGSP